MNGIVSPRGCRIFSVIAAALLFIHQDTPAKPFFIMNAPRRPHAASAALFSSMKNAEINGGVLRGGARVESLHSRRQIQKERNRSLGTESGRLCLKH